MTSDTLWKPDRAAQEMGCSAGPIPKLLTTIEAAAELGLSKAAVLALVKSGLLPYIDLGNGMKRARYRFDPDDLLGFQYALKPFVTEADAIAPSPHGTPVVYFVACDKMMKIGHTTRLTDRLRAVSNSASIPPVLLWWELGGREREKELHRQFKKNHSHLEWFRFNGELLEYVLEKREDYDERNDA